MEHITIDTMWTGYRLFFQGNTSPVYRSSTRYREALTLRVISQVPSCRTVDKYLTFAYRLWMIPRKYEGCPTKALRYIVEQAKQ